MIRWKAWYGEPHEGLPVDVLPCSNGEFVPGDPSPAQRAVMALAEEETDRLRRRFNMSRREFVRTAAALGAGLWAIDQVMGTRWGSYALAHNTATNAACDLEWPGAQLDNLPGELIFDVQSHHVDPDGTWRLTNPSIEAFFAATWPQAGGFAPAPDPDPYWPTQTPFRGGREVDPIENLSRYHYLKELFLDSSTNVTVLSAVPSEPGNNPLPVAEAALTVDTVQELAGGAVRSFMHAFVMPNRGASAAGRVGGGDRRNLEEELDRMSEHRERYGDRLRGWKVYTPWGDVPYGSGWFLDSDLGLRFCGEVDRVGTRYGMPRIIAAHKGFALPGFDQRAASPHDVGPAARQFPGVAFLIYHSGYYGERQRPYPGDDRVDSAGRGVDCLIKSLRENDLDARRHVPPGLEHGNSPNVYAEIGSTWRSVMGDPAQAAHLLGKLITYVGALRICWGTDSLWYGSPQSEVVAMRAFGFSERAKELYNLPHGLDGDAWDPRQNAMSAAPYRHPHPHAAGWPADHRPHPERSIRNRIFGRNAAEVYQVDPEAALKAIRCDDVQQLRDGGYLAGRGTPRARAPLSSNALYGYRTRRQLFADRASKPWSP